jgi:hypothetical protein
MSYSTQMSFGGQTKAASFLCPPQSMLLKRVARWTTARQYKKKPLPVNIHLSKNLMGGAETGPNAHKPVCKSSDVGG